MSFKLSVVKRKTFSFINLSLYLTRRNIINYTTKFGVCSFPGVLILI